jgi:hypothetical protein
MAAHLGLTSNTLLQEFDTWINILNYNEDRFGIEFAMLQERLHEAKYA